MVAKPSKSCAYLPGRRAPCFKKEHFRSFFITGAFDTIELLQKETKLQEVIDQEESDSQST